LLKSNFYDFLKHVYIYKNELIYLKECQEKSWKSVHKKLCSQAKTLLGFSCLPRHKFEDHFSFRTEIDKYSNYKLAMPNYIYSADLSQIKTQSRVLG
jgi:hypothetical protein